MNVAITCPICKVTEEYSYKNIIIKNIHGAAKTEEKHRAIEAKPKDPTQNSLQTQPLVGRDNKKEEKNSIEKEVKNLYNENYKTLMQEIEEDTKD